jgi:O-antigen/teichoic acid export membrane protein
MSEGYVWSVLSKSILIIYSLILLKVTSVFLSEKEFSTFYMLMNAGIYIMPVLFGMQSAMILRFYHHKKKHLQATISTLNWIATIFIILLTFIMSYFYSNAYVVTIFVIGFGIYQYLISKLRAQHKFKKVAMFTFFHLLITSLLFMQFIESNNNAIFLLIIISIGYLLIAMKYIFFEYKSFDVKKINMSVVRYSIPIVFIAIFNSALSSMDQYFLFYFNYGDSLAGYIVNYNIGEKIVFSLLSVISMVFIPVVFKKHKELTMSAINEIYKTVIIFIIFSSVLVLVMYMMSDYLVILFADERYLNTSWIIPIVGVNTIILGVVSIGSEVFTIKKTTSVIMYLYFTGFVINFILNTIFIPYYGVPAAIISTLAAYFAMLLHLLILVRIEKIKFKEWEYV